MLGTFLNITPEDVGGITGHTNNLFSSLLPIILILIAIPLSVAILLFLRNLVSRSLFRKKERRKKTIYLMRLEKSFTTWIGAHGVKPEMVKELEPEKRARIFKEFLAEEKPKKEKEKWALPYYDIPVEPPKKL